MPITEILKSKNIFNINKNSSNNMLKLVNEFANICTRINEYDKENIYLTLSKFYLTDIINQYEEEKDIIFNFDKTCQNILFDINNTDIQQYYKALIKNVDCKDSIIISSFYYLLSDIVEIYGIDNIREIFEQTKQLKMTR